MGKRILASYKLGIKVILLAIPLVYSTNLLSKIHDFETTRLKSTAGAGVASFLMDEATVLNPAPLAFFNNSAIYFQKSGTDLSDSSDQPLSGPDSGQTAFIASDSNGSVNGSISYQKYNELMEERKRWSFSMANRIGKKSAMGVTYHHTTDTLQTDSGSLYKERYKQIVLGFSHVLGESVSMGLIVKDPLKERFNETRAVLGFQYNYKDMISFMADGGADYNQNLSQTSQYSGAVQAKIFKDFYLRAGVFEDKGKSERGNGAGVGWVQPKLVINLGLKNVTTLANKKLEQVAGKIKESSFSLSYRF